MFSDNAKYIIYGEQNKYMDLVYHFGTIFWWLVLVVAS